MDLKQEKKQAVWSRGEAVMPASSARTKTSADIAKWINPSVLLCYRDTKEREDVFPLLCPTTWVALSGAIIYHSPRLFSSPYTFPRFFESIPRKPTWLNTTSESLGRTTALSTRPSLSFGDR